MGLANVSPDVPKLRRSWELLLTPTAEADVDGEAEVDGMVTVALLEVHRVAPPSFGSYVDGAQS